MQTIFLELIKLSLIGSLFAGAVMLVRLIFPKTPRWIFCLLWGVVALRLICPLSIESSISLVPDRIDSAVICGIIFADDIHIADVLVSDACDDLAAGDPVGNKRKAAFNGNRADQPQSHHAPQQADDPLWRFR